MKLSPPTPGQLPSARYTGNMSKNICDTIDEARTEMVRDMAMETRELLAAAHEARAKHRVGAMEYEEARAIVKRYIDHANVRAREISREHGMRYKPMSVTTFMR